MPNPQQNDPYQPASIYPAPTGQYAPVPTPVAPRTILGSASNPAVEMIRQKISALYDEEPDAAVETVEAETRTHPGSRHQQYMRQLNASGKSLIENLPFPSLIATQDGT